MRSKQETSKAAGAVGTGIEIPRQSTFMTGCSGECDESSKLANISPGCRTVTSCSGISG